MIKAIADIDFDKLLEGETISREAVTYIKDQVYSSKENREKLDAKIESLKLDIKKEHDSVKVKDLILILGICEWIVGKVKEASELLKEVKSRKTGAYYLGKCYQELGDYNQALECFERAKKTDMEEFDIHMDIAETKRMSGDIEDALKIIKGFLQAHGNSAELHCQWGCCLDELGEYQEAFKHYEQALQIDPNYAKALFRMAFNYDMNGEDEKALEYYERCINLSPNHKNAFINLGILHEDRGNYDEAAYCFEMVLDAEPTNARALLFLKDAKASISMYYDEEISKKQGKESEVLNIPISDFELSVRSKNCLEKMNIRTLKDLTKITEAELLSFKNFGETSLNEIKAILAQKGLRLGQALESDTESELFSAKMTMEEEGDAIEDISELNLSARCRNVLSKAGIERVEDLLKMTDVELSQKGVKENYLDEIKENLSKFGLSLRTGDNSEAEMERNATE
ncbi:MAG: tetratricopeptide repeat protein [Candidatus Brocadia sp. AMX2]|uniref:DNA-directed RNA polymerase subunit alpha n=1 Tax=Candidatus Brocadia sinica JPN1 TaxID=1197129 RepID=A0ABQ0JVA9_9BACT|nr:MULTISPECIES: tetratricopeptide repeat protein [Brocadia]KXK32784.1 MAG: putative RNA polymerase alpha subunit [Candidatus Brocadia sinica]MBC6930960.1 tetratricopeptide repeat protein [Candidatus Brocadia sp.]MBL1167950.1 tetratricopeptide repeat protein [Candidatus Brocadia sp. AMX1]NOG41489.1 tetratricopeptide repeat protein [Planctomycetota bacterium]KAA0245331.1 MAG: tetratricopeptide repeat protein [Candidatus Brocadia sp. AMX2]